MVALRKSKRGEADEVPGSMFPMSFLRIAMYMILVMIVILVLAALFKHAKP